MATYSSVKQAAADAAGIGGSVTTYSTPANLPTSGNEAGDQAFVSSNNRLYIWNGSGWYNIALINTNPSFTSSPDGSYVLATDGTPTTISLLATDPEGLTVAYSAVPDADFSNLATVSQSANVFTITPLSADSATTTSGNLTFRASDGVNIVSAISEFTISFTVANSRFTSLLTKAAGNAGTNSTFTDGSTNSHTITAVGDTHSSSFTPHHPGGYSTYFDGSGDYVQVASSSDFAFGSNDFTIEFWAYPEAIATAAVLDPRTTDSQAVPWIGLRNTGYFYYYVSGSNRIVGTTGTVTANNWYHVAVSRSSGTTKMFVNGTQIGSDYSDSTSYVQGGPWRTGTRYNNATLPFKGYIRDFRCINGTALYTADFTTPTESLTAVANTKLLHSHLPYFADGSSNSHTITVNGDTKVKPFGPYDYEPYSVSSHGASVYLDGSGDRITIPWHNGFDFGSGDFTIEMWYNLSDVEGLISWGSSASDRFDITATSNNLIRVLYNHPSYTNFDNRNGSDALPNVWQHFACVRHGDTLTYYINGVLQATQAFAAGALMPVDTANGITIGARRYATSTSDSSQGYFKDVRIVKGTAVYTSDFTPPTAPLSAITNTELLLQSSPNVYDASGSTRVVLSGVTSANLNTKYTSNIVLDGGAEKVFFYPVNGSYHNDVTGDFTVETWIRLDSNTIPYAYLWSIRNSANTGGPRIQARFGDSGFGYHLQFELNGTGLAAVHSVNLTQSNFNTYKHVALTRSNGVVRCFVDGTQYSFGTGANPSSFPNSTISFSNSITNINEIIIGDAVDGQIEDFRFTNGLARYTSNFTPPTSELLG